MRKRNADIRTNGFHFSASRLYVLLLVAVIAGDLTGRRFATAQDRTQVFREAVTVNVETQVVKTIETAREHMIEGQWDQAIAILQQTIDSSRGTVIPVEPGRYLNTSDYCHLLLSQLPPTGLRSYRDRIDGQARTWFEVGRESLDAVPLQRIVDSAFNSSYGDDALWLLGELAFERGRFAKARQYWQLLVPSLTEAERSDVRPTEEFDKDASRNSALNYLTYPDPDAPRSEVLARLILCSIFEGDRQRASDELAAYSKIEPEAAGSIAGQTGNLAETVSGFLEASAHWTDSKRLSEVMTVPGGQLSRVSIPQVTPGATSLIWRRPLPDNRFVGPASRPALAEDRSPCYLPLVHGDTVFTCDSDSIFAFDLKTGKARWPIDENDDGRIFTNILERPVSPHLPAAGIAWYPLSFSEGRLYARMGPPVMRRSRNEGNCFSEIVGLDVARREGELVFRVTSDVFDPDAHSPEATSWSFAGTPLVSNGRVFVAARRGAPEDETLVACFDADSSRLLWRRRVCASLKNASDRFNLIGQNLLTLGDGRLFLATGTGAVASLNAETGRLLWVMTYESDRQEQAHELSDPRKVGLTPCVFHQGVVYTAPPDTKLMFALDATTGQLVWREQFPDRVLHIAGIVDGRMILSGRAVWAVHARDGQPAWPQRIGFADPAGQGHGRPALTRDALFWPVRDEILRIDHRNGQVVERIRLRDNFGMTAGNLVVTEDRLLIAQSKQLVALGTADAERPPNNRPPRDQIKAVSPRAVRFQKNGSHAGTIRLASYQKSRASFPLTTGQPSSASTRSARQAAALRSETHLWPAQRSWKAAVPDTSRVLFPHGSGATDVCAPLIFDSGIVYQLNPSNGLSQWRVHVDTQPSHAVSAGNVVVLGNSAAVTARDRETGRLVWRRTLAEAQTGKLLAVIAGKSEQLVAITESTAQGLDVLTGETRWQVPATVRRWRHSSSTTIDRSARFVTSEDHLLFRPAGSNSYLLAELRSGKVLKRGGLPFAATGTLLLLKPGSESHGLPATLGIDRKGNVQAAQLQSLGIRWRHQSHGHSHGPPHIFTNEDSIIVVEDGQFLLRLNVQNGEAIWRRPLGPSPLVKSPGQLVFAKGHLLVISDRVLRSFAVEDGHLNWQQYIGGDEWTLKCRSDFVVCLPAGSRNEDNRQPSNITICDTATGDLVQRIAIGEPVSGDDFWIGDSSCLVRTDQSIVHLRSWLSATN